MKLSIDINEQQSICWETVDIYYFFVIMLILHFESRSIFF